MTEPRLTPEAQADLDSYRRSPGAGQQIRPQAEQEMPQWQRDALDRERSRPRNIDDVLSAIETLRVTVNDIQARIYRIEHHLALTTKKP